MRVLFTCVVGHGHFNPMVPLARAFEAAGHQAAFATDPGFVEHVRGVGFEAFPSGLDMPEAIRRFVEQEPAFRQLPPWEQMRHIMPGLFGGVRVEPMLADLDRVIDDWRPDVLIHDSAEMAGGIAAERAGIAHAEHAIGLLRPLEFRQLATDVLEPICERLGVSNPGVGGINGELYLDICPPGIQRAEIAAVERVQPLRPVGLDEAPGSAMPPWLDRLPDVPTVYVTFGTVFNEDAALFDAILAGIEGEDLNIIVTVGPRGDPAVLGARPDNVHIEPFIPQSRLLPYCSVFINHGGSGALIGAANAGVPVLAIPQGADQFFNADVIQERGIGLRLLPDEVSPETVRDATRALVEDPAYGQTIRGLRAAIDRMPTPDDIVPLLERLVDS
jgi:UDP:flavonoid glycosyltransferase YjiC (YdhE family)